MKRTFFALIIAFVFVSLTSPTFGQAEQKKKKDNPAASANTSSRSLISSSSNNNERTAETFEIITVDDVSFKMIFVSGGVFRMGCTSEVEQYCWSDEYPSHDVTLDDYYIGETEVTQDLWQVVMGTSPTGDDRWTYTLGLGDNYPAYRISYEDVKEFITRLNSMTGRTFRMPTEAEWEFAARGGNKSRHYMYSGSNNINDVAWCLETADGEHNYPVKQKKPNELGIYDMSGNVYEWCMDWYDEYVDQRQVNPSGPAFGDERVYRGCCVAGPPRSCRVSDRNKNQPSFRGQFHGVRLVMEPNK